MDCMHAYMHSVKSLNVPLLQFSKTFSGIFYDPKISFMVCSYAF